MKVNLTVPHFFVLFFSILFCACAVSVSAQSTNPGLGRLAQFMPATGQNDNWRFVNGNNSFEIENIGDTNAITYFYVGPENGTEGRRTIEASVNIHPDSRGSAGLIYGLDRDRGVYHMLTINASGMVTLFRRDNQGFRPMMEQSSSAYQAQRMNTLRIQENGNEISFSLNGTSIGQVGGNLFGFGSVGLGMVGDVRAFFNMFSDGGSDQSGLQIQDQNQVIQTTQNANDAIEVRPIQIIDQRGPAGQPVVAYQTMIPADWKTQGGVSWNANDGQGQCFTGARLIWSALSPDET